MRKVDLNDTSSRKASVLWLWFSLAFLLAAVGGFMVTLGPLFAIIIAGFAIWLVWVILIPKRSVSYAVGVGALGLNILIPVFAMGPFSSWRLMVVGGVVGLLAGLFVNKPAEVLGALGRLKLWVVYLFLLGVATTFSGISDPSVFAILAVFGLTVSLSYSTMSPRETLSSLRFIVLLALLESIYAMGEAFSLVPKLWGSWASEGLVRFSQIVQGVERAQGTMGHPLPLSLFLLVGAVILLNGDVVGSPSLRVLLTISIFGGILATGSRSAILVFVALAALLVFRDRLKSIAFSAVALSVTAWLLALSGFQESEVVRKFLGSDSLAHRQGALESLPRLWANQDWLALWFGNGSSAHHILYERGLLQQGNFYAVDNGFVTTFIETGVVGLVLLAANIVLIAKRFDLSGLLVVAISVFFFSFDVLLWPSGLSLLAFAFGLASQQRSRQEGSGIGTCLLFVDSSDSDRSELSRRASTRSESARELSIS